MGNKIYASPLQRQLAYAVDVILIVAPFTFLYIISSGWFRLAMDFKESNDPIITEQIRSLKSTLKIYNLILLISYSTLLEAFTRRGTIGKRLLKIRTRNLEGDRISFLNSLKRNIAKTLVVPATMLILWDPERRGGHDYFSDTIVIRKHFDDPQKKSK